MTCGFAVSRYVTLWRICKCCCGRASWTECELQSDTERVGGVRNGGYRKCREMILSIILHNYSSQVVSQKPITD